MPDHRQAGKVAYPLDEVLLLALALWALWRHAPGVPAAGTAPAGNPFATAKSDLPSPLKSPTVTERGLLPTEKLVAGPKLPVPMICAARAAHAR